MPRDLNRHQCPISACTELIAGLMCKPHFLMIDPDTRLAIRHARSVGRPWDDKEKAAIAAVEAKLGRTQP